MKNKKMKKPNFLMKSLLTLIIILTIGAVSFSITEKAEAKQASGWTALGSEILGDDESCGASAAVMDFQTVEYSNSNPVTVPSFIVRVYETDGTVSNTISVINGSITSAICFDTANQSLSFSIDGGASYYDFVGRYVWSESPTTQYGKRVRANVHLRPTTFATQDIAHISPVGGETLSAEPSYQIALNDFPNIYSATESYRISLFIRDPSNTTHVYRIPVAGGKGVYTISPRGFTEEGLYSWSFAFGLNGKIVSVSSAVPMSVFSGWESFRINKSPKVTASFVPAGPILAPTNSTSLNWTISNATSANITCTGPLAIANTSIFPQNGSYDFSNLAAGTQNCVISATGGGETISDSASIIIDSPCVPDFDYAPFSTGASCDSFCGQEITTTYYVCYDKEDCGPVNESDCVDNSILRPENVTSQCQPCQTKNTSGYIEVY